jgi:plasmid stabilization system protein ParE
VTSNCRRREVRYHPRTTEQLWQLQKSTSSREVRILLYEHYRITYLIKQDGDIDILGVFHGALDIERYFI